MEEEHGRGKLLTSSCPGNTEWKVLGTRYTLPGQAFSDVFPLTSPYLLKDHLAMNTLIGLIPSMNEVSAVLIQSPLKTLPLNTVAAGTKSSTHELF
jgi:hypothetical protein